MTTAIENNELDTELQELYLTGKQWLSNLEFLQEELIFLNTLAEITALPELHEDYERIFLLERTHDVIKLEASDFLKKLEPLISGSEKIIHIDVVEDYLLLKLRFEDLWKTFRATRKFLFELVLLIKHGQHN